MGSSLTVILQLVKTINKYFAKPIIPFCVAKREGDRVAVVGSSLAVIFHSDRTIGRREYNLYKTVNSNTKNAKMCIRKPNTHFYLSESPSI